MNQELFVMKKKISRREFARQTAVMATVVSLDPFSSMAGNRDDPKMIRLGGPLFTKYSSPDEWVGAVRELGYRAAKCPLEPGAGREEIRAYEKAAFNGDIIIAEVGTWSNPVSPDETERKEAVEKCIRGLQLADEIGAACCVNISGSRNEKYWAGPHEDNLTDETFHMVVESTRKIIDAVKPVRTWFTLEAMPWAFPYSADSYLRLIKAIDRNRFAVHLDPVNMVTGPLIYFRNADMIRECFRKLGPDIRSCHAKDIILREDNFTPHLSEIRPGLGKLDYNVFLTELSKLQDVPLILEHLDTAGEYRSAAEYIRSVAERNNIAC